MAPRTPTGLRAKVHELTALTSEAHLRLALRPGGGRLGWAVKVCNTCPITPPTEGS